MLTVPVRRLGWPAPASTLLAGESASSSPSLGAESADEQPRAARRGAAPARWAPACAAPAWAPVSQERASPRAPPRPVRSPGRSQRSLPLPAPPGARPGPVHGPGSGLCRRLRAHCGDGAWPARAAMSAAESPTQRWLRQNTQPYAHRDSVFADVDAVLTRYPTVRPKTDVYSSVAPPAHRLHPAHQHPLSSVR